MNKKRFFKLMHINMTRELKEYLDWRSNKINRSVSEIIRLLIKEDLKKNKIQWFNELYNDYDMLESCKDIKDRRK